MVGLAGEQIALERASRDCPICRTPPDAGTVIHEERFDPRALGPLAFAARKQPERMHWRLVECGGCGLLFASPAPTAAAIAREYRAAEYDATEEARYAGRTYVELLREVLPRLPSSGPVLDIGAGDGSFLLALGEEGLTDLMGVEPSRAARATAPDHVRPRIREGVFDVADFERDAFRLVSCLHVVDHLEDPVTALRGAHALLQPGGAVFVVCHDRRALVNRLLGKRSPIYDIEHLQLFCARSLRQLLEVAGFGSPDVWSFSNRYPLRYWVRLAPLGRRTKPALARAVERARLGAAALTMPTGNLAAVAWKGSPA